MKVVFMGTPDFAAASLRRLVADGHEICGVFTQPDKPRNRGMKLAFSSVKGYALSENLPVYQPERMRDTEAIALLRALAPELAVVAAYGQLLPEDVLAVPAYGCINVHASLLPKYRGAAPINWAILNGDAETGVTIMHMAKKIGRRRYHFHAKNFDRARRGRGGAVRAARGIGRGAAVRDAPGDFGRVGGADAAGRFARDLCTDALARAVAGRLA